MSVCSPLPFCCQSKTNGRFICKNMKELHSKHVLIELNCTRECSPLKKTPQEIYNWTEYTAGMYCNVAFKPPYSVSVPRDVFTVQADVAMTTRRLSDDLDS